VRQGRRRSAGTRAGSEDRCRRPRAEWGRGRAAACCWRVCSRGCTAVGRNGGAWGRVATRRRNVAPLAASAWGGQCRGASTPRAPSPSHRPTTPPELRAAAATAAAQGAPTAGCSGPQSHRAPTCTTPLPPIRVLVGVCLCATAASQGNLHHTHIRQPPAGARHPVSSSYPMLVRPRGAHPQRNVCAIRSRHPPFPVSSRPAPPSISNACGAPRGRGAAPQQSHATRTRVFVCPRPPSQPTIIQPSTCTSDNVATIPPAASACTARFRTHPLHQCRGCAATVRVMPPARCHGPLRLVAPPHPAVR
jgi:hypothetical protein